MKQDETFLLVKSLTKEEKRLFKLYASITTGDKNYSRLFEVMEKLDEYDEKWVKKNTRMKSLLNT